MSRFTFGDVKFQAPGSQLHVIAQNGILDLFKYWMTVKSSSDRPGEWAATETFLKYVQDCYEQTGLKRVDHEASVDGAAAVTELLATTKGLHYFTFNGLYSSSDDNMSFVVDFVDQDRVTVATTNGQATIFCQDFDRTLWTANFIKDLAERKGGVFSRAGSPADSIKILY